MRATLLLRIEGPMQSWGTESRFDVRDTCREPSKSGIVGLLCAALGKPRHESAADPWPSLGALSALTMVVRVDREGRVAVDYQTAGGANRRDETYGVRRASDRPGDPVQSRRYYLAGASFLVGLEGDRALVEILARAVRQPVWPLYFGRKSYVPGVPVQLPDEVTRGRAVLEEPLEQALRTTQWDVGHRSVPRRFVMEVPFGRHSEVRRDVPVDFERRLFAQRYVAVEYLEGAED